MSARKRWEVIDLRETANKTCRYCGDRDERRQVHADGICMESRSTMDGLPIRCVGRWALEKIYWLSRYFGIFAQGMHKKWQGLNYVEICSGPGRCIVRETGKEIDGTSLAIVNHPSAELIGKALFIDNSPVVVDTLNQRIRDMGAEGKASAERGDYSDRESIVRLVSRLPGNCLNLIFVDPTDCSVPFDTVRAVFESLQNCDLLINIAMMTDVNRNISSAIDPSHAKVRAKYTDFLGEAHFFARPEVQHASAIKDHQQLRRLFAESYRASLRKHGYEFFDIEPVRNLYHLLFATRNEKGLAFWNKACAWRPDGQAEMSL